MQQQAETSLKKKAYLITSQHQRQHFTNAPSTLEKMPLKCHVNQYSLPLSHRTVLLPVPLLWGYVNITAPLLHCQQHFSPPTSAVLLTPKLFRSQQNGSLLNAHQQPCTGHAAPEEVSSSSTETHTQSVTSRGTVKGTATTA